MTRRALAGLALLAAGAGCGDGSGPTAGVVMASLSGPVPARAVMFRLVGAQSGITAPTGSSLRVFSTPLGGDTVRVAVIAPAGGTIAARAADIAVPDLGRRPVLILEQVAGATYALQNVATYSLVFVTSP